MTPVDQDSRISHLEQEQARLGQRLTDLDGRIREVLPLGVSFAELRGTVDATKHEITRVGDQVQELRSSVLSNERDRRLDEGQNRRGTYQLLANFGAPLLAAVVAALLALLLSGAHP